MIPDFRIPLTLGLSSLTLLAGTPLSKAVIEGNLGAAKSLVGIGERPDELDKWGWTPLMWACFYRDFRLVHWLLSNGANPDILSVESFRKIPAGTTALAIACLYGNEDQVKELLRHKADPSIKNAKGRVARDYALENRYQGILDLLDGRTPVASLASSDPGRVHVKAGDRVLILCKQGKPDTSAFLQEVLDDLVKELARRNIQAKGLFEDALERDKQLRSEADAFKPTFTLALVMTQSDLRNNKPFPPRVVSATFDTKLKLASEQGDLLKMEVTGEDSARRSIRDFTGDAALQLTQTLMMQLEDEARL